MGLSFIIRYRTNTSKVDQWVYFLSSYSVTDAATETENLYSKINKK